MTDQERDRIAARAAGEDFPGVPSDDVDALLQGDDARDELNELAAVLGVLREASAVPPSARRRERVMQAVRPTRPTRRVAAWWQRPAVVAAAMVLVAATVVIVLLVPPVPPARIPQPIGGTDNSNPPHYDDNDNRPLPTPPTPTPPTPVLVSLLAPLTMQPTADGPLLRARDFTPMDGASDGGDGTALADGGPDETLQDLLRRTLPFRIHLPSVLPKSCRLAQCRLLKAGEPGIAADTLWLVWSTPAGPIVLLQTAEPAGWPPHDPLPANWHRADTRHNGTALRVITPAIQVEALAQFLHSLRAAR
ncbi:MAG: hypothetical protein AB7K09_00995 [Planctomycetota bacterium]